MPSGADQGTVPGVLHWLGVIEITRKEGRGHQRVPRPTTKKQVCVFLGLVGYYHFFIPNFSSVPCPLANLMTNGQPDQEQWTSNIEWAFLHLKEALKSHHSEEPRL